MSTHALRFELYDKQLAFVRSAAKFSAFVAGRGAGKSHAGVVKDLLYMMEHPGCVGVIGAPTYPMLRDTTRRTFFQLCPSALIKSYNKVDNEVELINGSVALFRSCHDPDRLRGPNLAFIHLDEAGYINRHSWRILKATLRLPGFPLRSWLTSTPKGRNWIYDEWVQRPTPDHALFKARSSDNFVLPDDFEESLGYAGRFAAQEIEGEFVAWDGLVYSGFAADRHLTVVANERVLPYRRAVCGVDWGFRDPAVLIVVLDHGDGVYTLVEEWYESRRTLDEHIAAAQDVAARWSIEAFVADPSRPDAIEAFRRAGLPIRAADNDMLTGISAVTTALAQTRDQQGTVRPGLLVNRACVQTINEFETYCWPEEKSGPRARNSKDRPVDFANHAMDALRYAIQYLAAPAALFRSVDVAAALRSDLAMDTELFA